MDAKNKKVLEALQMQPLSEEEKASRHILGRLYGPIATCKEGTRNGRKYNKELWVKDMLENIETDDVQKIADIVLQEAIDNDYGIPKDDMTVLVAKIEKI